MLSHFSYAQLFVTPWTVACQASLSIGKYTGVCCHGLLQGSSPPRDGTHISYISALAGGFFTTSASWEAPISLSFIYWLINHLSLHLHLSICPFLYLNSWTRKGRGGLTLLSEAAWLQRMSGVQEVVTLPSLCPTTAILTVLALICVWTRHTWLNFHMVQTKWGQTRPLIPYS